MGTLDPDEVAAVFAPFRDRLLALPVHEISGYEWECYEPDTGCHWHMYGRPLTCGHEMTGEGNYDRDGVLCDHQRLVDLDRILAIIGRMAAPIVAQTLRNAQSVRGF